MKRATLTAKNKVICSQGFFGYQKYDKNPKALFIMEIYEIYINLWNLNIST
ncbi:MAG: hypothetical protein ACLS5E_05325 [[Ruminococcus] lactaris]